MTDSDKVGIVYNACYGGFGLSEEAKALYKERGGPVDELNYNWDWDNVRADPILVGVVEELKKKSSDVCADIEVEYLPKGTVYYIHEYDGYERVMTFDSHAWKIA